MENRGQRLDGNSSGADSVRITKRLTSFIPNDYNDLDNIPTINGTKVQGDLTSEDIKVLSENPDDYESEEFADSDGYLTVVNDDGKPTKIPVESVKTAVQDSINETAELTKTELKEEFEQADKDLAETLTEKIGDVDEKADEALEEAKKAGTKFIGTKIEDGDLVIVTADYLDATFDINPYGHLEVVLGESNAKQVTRRVVGSMFYSGLAETSGEMITEVVKKHKLPLAMDMYLNTDTGELWQYNGVYPRGEFVYLFTLASENQDMTKYATEIDGELEDDELSVSLKNSQGAEISKKTLVMPYMRKADVETYVDDKVGEVDAKIEDTDIEKTYQQVNVNKSGIVKSGANVVEYWDKGQTESDTLADGGFAFVKIPDSVSFGEDSWSTISEIVSLGRARDTYPLGAVKMFTTKGGEEVEVRVAGYDHDGENTMTLETVGLTSKTYPMNEKATNDGGYSMSQMAVDTLSDMLADLPDELQAVIKVVNKGTMDGDMKAKLYVPAFAEIYSKAGIRACGLTGISEYADEYIGEDAQLEYYKNLIGDLNPSTACDDIAKGATYWLRTPHMGTSDCFWALYRNGQLISWTANSGLNVSVCFAI